MKKPANSISILFILLLVTLFSCVRKTDIEETNIKETNIEEINIGETYIKENKIISEIKLLEKQIVQNIAGNYDIDSEIDINRIKTMMEVYEPQTNSIIIKINDNPHDLLIIEQLSNSFSNIRINWNNIRKEQIEKLINECIKAKMEKKYIDIYALTNTLSYYFYQAETSKAFFSYLLEQFRLPNAQYDLSELPEITIEILPLSITAINIDDIPYDSVAVETLRAQMMQITESVTKKISYELINEVNIQFDRCVNNVDSYLDWYYGFFTSIGKFVEMIKGGFDANRTMGGAIQEYMINNYVEKIGYGVSFDKIINILQNGRTETIELALVFISVLDECNLDFDISPDISENITGDDFMSSFYILPDYLEKVVSEGLPIIGMGNKLDHEGIPLLDLINLAVNFLPGVGFIAGTVLDGITLKLTEHWKRPEFKEQIISSIRNTQNTLYYIVNNYH
jgi:hypothetical protein